ncbi:MAG: hypothetical protein V7765_07360 [Oleispira sp.]
MFSALYLINMIYLEEKWFSKQMDFLKFFLETGEFEVIIWMYPESKFSHLSGLSLESGADILGKPVTIYEDGHVPSRTERQPLTKYLIDLVEINRRNVSRNVDSFVIYNADEFEWLACTIGHEGMCLVQDESKINDLTDAGFSASLKAPNWW